MSENLKVNANSSVLEHKRKHNLLVDAVPKKDTDGNYKIFENIIDSQGHNRFIEGDINLESNLPEGITKTYGKWSLSGSHLLIVLALDIENAVEITSGRIICNLSLPNWIKDKIVALFGSNISISNQLFWNEDVTSQSTNIYLRKIDGNIVIISGALTTNKARSTRIAFDLLIDNAEPEETEEQGE